MTVGPDAASAVRSALERGVALDPHAPRTARPRGGGEVERSEVRPGHVALPARSWWSRIIP